MIAFPKVRTVAELMDEAELQFEELVQLSGVGPSVVDAIVQQRYTPSPEQRASISSALGVERELVIWGHRHTVESQIHSPD